MAGVGRRLGAAVAVWASADGGVFSDRGSGLQSAHWAASENNRRARYYTLTSAGRKHLQAEKAEFTRLIDAIHRVLLTA